MCSDGSRNNKAISNASRPIASQSQKSTERPVLWQYPTKTGSSASNLQISELHEDEHTLKSAMMALQEAVRLGHNLLVTGKSYMYTSRHSLDSVMTALQKTATLDTIS